MPKLKSSLRNMILSLMLISVVMAAALSYVYIVTKEPIEKALQQKEADAIRNVLPTFDNDPVKDKQMHDGLEFFPATLKGDTVGCAVKTFTEKAFNGRFDLMVGFLPDGSINNVIVLKQKETPGLGTQMSNDKFKNQFLKKDFSTFKLAVKKDGGDVDAITAATISSRAYCDAIDKAYRGYMKYILKKEPEIPQMCGPDDTCELRSVEPIRVVMPGFTNDPLKEKIRVKNVDVFVAKKGDEIIGYAIKTSAKGYIGPVWVLTGLKPDGTIVCALSLKNKESVGYGSRLKTEPAFCNQVKGKNIFNGPLAVKTDDGTIDALSGATITSRAYLEAINIAGNILAKEILKKPVVADTTSIAKPIDDKEKAKKLKQVKAVLPEFDNDPVASMQKADGCEVYCGKKGNTIVGYAVRSVSDKAYNGKLTLMVGFKPDGSIKKINVLKQNETQGFGTRVYEPEFKSQIIGKNPSSFKVKVKEDGGDVDAVSGATITSRAYCDAVEKAWKAWKKTKGLFK
ncbi:MAG: RnfABCDGE type electron transport complex subunit G [Bacteroidota bacterium]